MASTNKYCEPCNIDGRSVEATVWCNECEEPLCKDCETSHNKIKVSRNHHTIDIKLITSGRSIAVLDKYCKEHTELEIEAFCISHDELCCRSCMTGKHRNCPNVLPLEVASKNAKKSELFTSISKSMESMSDTAGLIIENLKTNERLVNEKTLKLKKEVSTAKQKIIDHLNKIESDINEQITKINSDAALKRNKEITEVKELKGKISQKCLDAEFIEKHGSNNQAFIFSHKNQSEVNNVEQSLLKMTSMNRYDVSFIDSSDEVVKSIKGIGRISIEQKKTVIPYTPHYHHQAQSVAESTKTITKLELDHKFDTNKSVFGMSVTINNELLTCEYGGKLVKKTDYNGTFIGSITMSSEPHGITLIPNTETAVVTLHKIKSLKFISVREMKETRTVQLPGEGKGISSSSGKIVVGGLKSLYILDTTGQLIQTLNATNKESFPIQFTHVCTDGSIVYTDTTAVYKINNKGQELWTYTSKESTTRYNRRCRPSDLRC